MIAVLLSQIQDNLVLLLGAILSAVLVFFILSAILIPVFFTASLSLIMFIIVYGLTKAALRERHPTDRFLREKITGATESTRRKNSKRPQMSSLDVTFVTAYIISLLAAGLISQPNNQLFIPWEELGLMQIFQLTTAIILCFFAPGYAIVKIIDKERREIGPLLRLLLACSLSILVTGLGGYISAYLEYPALLTKSLLIGVNVSILLIFCVTNLGDIISALRSRDPWATTESKKLTLFAKKNSAGIIVFMALFILVILSTYYLYRGVIIGDQWFHHGRSLLFAAGAFTSVLDVLYPFFFHTMLAPFFSLTGVPSVNAYVSINFLNILPVMAFYYFVKKWIPNHYSFGAALLASALFMLGSGFGWINVLNLIAAGNNLTPPLSVLETLHLGASQTGDIQQPTTFINTAQPEPTSPLLLIGLPSGFILLGLMKEDVGSKIKYIAVIAAITTLGVLTHDEFYLFIIIASILPLTFRLPSKNSLYIAFSISLSLVILADNIFPVKYYTLREISGIPLIYLAFFFVASIWTLYATGILNKIKRVISGRLAKKRVSAPGARLGLAFVLAGAVSYLYLFTFVVWAQPSVTEVNANTQNVPWYMYPIKFGVAGLLGTAFVLSYLFRKFEREVFVFGLIAAVAFFAGPYYDEHRFSKYMMVCMTGLASLFVYKVIFNSQKLMRKPIFLGLTLGLVVTSSSLSTLLFIGYTALALENPDFEKFHKQLPRRVFPSDEDIRFLTFLNNDLINLKTDYVTVPPDWWGINSKLEGFVGTSLASLPKFLQSPHTLSSSSIEGFYNLLNYSNSRYIILSGKEISSSTNPDAAFTNVLNFALENFGKAYRDENYVVLAVPSFAPPSWSKAADVALVYQRDGSVLNSALLAERILPYHDEFSSPNDSNNVRLGKIDDIDSVTIHGDKERTTFWSKPLQKNRDVNYIEATFRIIGENKTSNDAGIMWSDGNKEFTVSVRNDRLEMLVEARGVYNSKEQAEKRLVNLRDMQRENNTWYTLKIAIMKDYVDIFVNDILVLQVPHLNKPSESRFYQPSQGTTAGSSYVTGISNNTSIVRVGLFTFDNIAQFKPMKIGQVSDPSYQKELRHSHYYPLSALALSATGYDTFVEGDFSALSKKIVILTRDPTGTAQETDKYLQFVEKGGILVILDADSNFDGRFGKFLSIKTGGETKFNSISNSWKVENLSGVIRPIYSEAPDAIPTSFYRYDDKKVSPFSVEKYYGKAGGRIIFVNGAGYFDAISRSPAKSFPLLAEIPDLINLTATKYHEEESAPDLAISGARFYGDLRMSGRFVINSSSLMLPEEFSTFYVSDVVVPDTVSGPDVDIQRNLHNHLNNLEIGNLTLYGAYEGKVNSAGTIYLPSSSSLYNYIDIPVPSGSNLTLKLSKGASAEFTISNGGKIVNHPIRIANAGEIIFHGITTPSGSLDSSQVAPGVIHFLMKSPEIKVDGDMVYREFYNPDSSFSNDRITYQGYSVTRLDHVDNQLVKGNNAYQTQYVTYIKYFQNSPDSNTDRQPISLAKTPGNIHYNANEVSKAFGSITNIFCLTTIILVTPLIWRWAKIDMELSRRGESDRLTEPK